MTVELTLTATGADTGPTFDLYTDADGYTTPIETGVAKTALVNGYSTALVPDLATIVRVQSIGNCINFTDITLTP